MTERELLDLIARAEREGWTEFIEEVISHCQRRGMLGQLERWARRAN